MTQQKYVISKRGAFKKVNEWYEHCKKVKLPYIVIETRIKYADINFDYISLPPQYEKYMEKDLELINEKAVQIFNNYANKKSKYRIGGLLIDFENVPIEYAEDAARDLFNLVKSSMPSA